MIEIFLAALDIALVASRKTDAIGGEHESALQRARGLAHLRHPRKQRALERIIVQRATALRRNGAVPRQGAIDRRARQLIVAQVQGLELRQRGQAGRNGAGKGVAGEQKRLQVHQTREARKARRSADRQIARDRIVAHVESLELRELEELRGQDPDRIVGENEVFEGRRVDERLCRHGRDAAAREAQRGQQRQRTECKRPIVDRVIVQSHANERRHLGDRADRITAGKQRAHLAGTEEGHARAGQIVNVRDGCVGNVERDILGRAKRVGRNRAAQTGGGDIDIGQRGTGARGQNREGAGELASGEEQRATKAARIQRQRPVELNGSNLLEKLPRAHVYILQT